VAPPETWQSKDGLRNGWMMTIPGRRPLATPAVADGRLFLGGGFGSYDFYALDVTTGHVVWQYQTEDDGLTAAVVHGAASPSTPKAASWKFSMLRAGLCGRNG
jgi:outer membrane protein assembly factor BamB